MGKHDKQESTIFSWSPMPDEWYRARISTLEKENLALREKVNNLEKEIGKLELIIDHDEEIRSGLTNEYSDYCREQQALITELKEAIVQAALREVNA